MAKRKTDIEQTEEVINTMPFEETKEDTEMDNENRVDSMDELGAVTGEMDSVFAVNDEVMETAEVEEEISVPEALPDDADGESEEDVAGEQDSVSDEAATDLAAEIPLAPDNAFETSLPESNDDEVGAELELEADGQEVRVATISETERQRRNAARRRERVRKKRLEAPLDEFGRPIMDGNGSFDETLADMARKRSTREIVGGYIEEVKASRNGREGWVEVMYEDVRVLIPFSRMDITVEDRADETAAEHAARLATTISNMVGAHIEYIITDIDKDNRIAGGSRQMANEIRRRDILNAKDREGNFTIYAGRKVRGYVLSVHPSFAFVDVYGMRCRLRVADIRSEYIADANDVLTNGMCLSLYITDLERDENGDVTKMFISMRNDKQEKERLQNAAATMKEGDICRGRVTSRSRDVIFLNLSNGLQAFVYITNGLMGRRIPNIGDHVSLRVVKVVPNRRNGNPIVQGKIIRNINYSAR